MLFRLIVSDYLERPAGDYVELLHRGVVSAPEGVDPEAWRVQIRQQAREDGIQVITRRNRTGAFAILNPNVLNERADEVLRDAVARGLVLQQFAERARQLAHEPTGWARVEDQYVSTCSRCGARIDAHVEARTVNDGEALSARCPGA